MNKLKNYETPVVEVVEHLCEGVLCESNRQIGNLEILEEQDW